jgi:hypothetical protein
MGSYVAVAQVIVDRFELSIFEQALTGGGLLAAVGVQPGKQRFTHSSSARRLLSTFEASVDPVRSHTGIQ